MLLGSLLECHHTEESGAIRMSARRICFVNTYYTPDDLGAAERSVRSLAEEIVKLGHEPTVICLGGARSSERIAEVDVERLPIRNLYQPLEADAQTAARKLLWHTRDARNRRMARAVGELLDRIRPDVLHTNNIAGFSAEIWRAARVRNIPIVHTLRDYYLLCPNTAMFRHDAACESRCASCRVLAWPRMRASAAVGCVVGVSRFILQKHVSAGCFHGAIQRVIANGYRCGTTMDGRPANGPVRFGYIGPLARSKGLARLLATFRDWTSAGRRAELLIAGTGNARFVQELREIAGAAPVRFAGYMQPSDFFGSVHFTVVPSEWDEPFGGVVIESLAHGIPVLSSASGGLPELIEAGRNGFLFGPTKPDELLRCLQLAAGLRATDGYARMRQLCRELAETYSPHQVAQQYSETYKLLKTRARPGDSSMTVLDQDSEDASCG
jgi:glycosyltransferase involved in cell wall biosynthesis